MRKRGIAGVLAPNNAVRAGGGAGAGDVDGITRVDYGEIAGKGDGHEVRGVPRRRTARFRSDEESNPQLLSDTTDHPYFFVLTIQNHKKNDAKGKASLLFSMTDC